MTTTRTATQIARAEKVANLKAAEKAWRADHPRAEWERGYTTSQPGTAYGRPTRVTLYDAYRNKDTGIVHYRHGSTQRVASAPLARRFTKLSAQYR